MSIYNVDIIIEENERLKDENKYLLQRLKEMRHKSWFPIFKENLDLQEEIKGLRNHIEYLDKQIEKGSYAIVENCDLRKEIEQYKTVLHSVQTFINQYSGEKKGDKGCH